MTSSFLTPGSIAKEHELATLHLRRDASIPVVLSIKVQDAEDRGYAEGMVTNTRFGSFPHSTIIGMPWGSQIRASRVDTGSRGRKERPHAKKRKADALEDKAPNGDASSAPTKDAVAASSGFVHVLPPTPESWTRNLPHRTQVVYTPDYSYILHRIRAQPGTRLIEAGSGSGSFTHAAARAVFNGYPPVEDIVSQESFTESSDTHGKVFSYEFHAERHRKVQAEMLEHGLDRIVRAMHRDVYKDGFLLHDDEASKRTSPRANAVFLDLPAPWEALPHLTRQSQDGTPSALDDRSPVYICTFSPCIEQVQRTISALRRFDWLEIETVEVQHRRIDIRREYTSLQYEGMRGVNTMAADVNEALLKLREVNGRARSHQKGNPEEARVWAKVDQNQQQQTLPFDGGRLIHRTEPDLKTHTSYLVFAVLPRSWSEEDEAEAQAKWVKHVDVTSNVPKSQRQLKKEAKRRTKGQREIKHQPHGQKRPGESAGGEKEEP
ncbi:uncharacterized protein A1O9_03470 [Exophiala aquamarina CBS 119918]|uniref:tRNA (adenine(58)-N(1))-methyltransferase catalytic subunit TRM61 n=1 Tax=Exophiala aquamarina CBS 119918 TaxID=1182545 RepID=A0A072PRE5_9EURO|nr:uncharacterized protein A1O9_03470 [Exophiala aquamarina CBS 119918]KEF61898.1 hypothetical protein A1O9_03470 [Exophiala aquamarina CBS 119918]